MAILITPSTKILVQGITGDFGGRHAKLSLDYGTQVVAGHQITHPMTQRSEKDARPFCTRARPNMVG